MSEALDDVYCPFPDCPDKYKVHYHDGPEKPHQHSYIVTEWEHVEYKLDVEAPDEPQYFNWRLKAKTLTCSICLKEAPNERTQD